MRLENDPTNPCFGCGPEHPSGLRLAFERDGDSVRAALHVTEAMQGWPRRLHSGLLYLAMLEVANWTVYGALARIGLPTRTSALDAQRWVAVGERLALVGRWDAASKTARIEARDERGAVVARLEREYLLPTRAEFRARMGADALTPELEALVPE